VKIGYFGSPELSARFLEAMIAHPEIEIPLVVSNPDRPRKRSGKPLPTAVSQVALDHAIPLYRFENLKEAEVVSLLKKEAVDLFFILAYGKLLPEEVLSIPRLGSVNLHASLLPLLRGASPIQSALLAGFETTGWSLQLITPELDAGDLIATTSIEIGPDDTAGDLTEKLIAPGIALSIESLLRFETLLAKRKPQENHAATHCKKLKVEESWIDWSQSGVAIHNRIRAMNPSPVARSLSPFGPMRLLRSQLPSAANLPDEVEKQLMKEKAGRAMVYTEKKRGRLFVRSGSGVLELIEIQPENRRAMTANEFINGLRQKDFFQFESKK